MKMEGKNGAIAGVAERKRRALVPIGGVFPTLM